MTVHEQYIFYKVVFFPTYTIHNIEIVRGKVSLQLRSTIRYSLRLYVSNKLATQLWLLCRYVRCDDRWQFFTNKYYQRLIPHRFLPSPLPLCTLWLSIIVKRKQPLIVVTMSHHGTNKILIETQKLYDKIKQAFLQNVLFNSTYTSPS